MSMGRGADGTAQVAEECAAGDDRVTVIRAQQRQGALYNTIWGVDTASPSAEDVIVVLDGDDWYFLDLFLIV
jgi:glycosyltransferase involved in cell wall biosynthesis